jgi:hypothetical protein
VLRAYYQMLKDDPDGARLFVIEIARVGPAVDAVWGALLPEFGEVLSRMVAPDSDIKPKPGELVRAGVVGAWCRSPRNGSGAVTRAASMPWPPTR